MYGNTTTDLSLNIPARCLTSIPNDTQHHRFLVAPCALPSSEDTPEGNRGIINPLYLLRYHEDMNELTMDASLAFPAEDGGAGAAAGGEIWNCSSCPFDKTLVVTNREMTTGNGAETVLWRIPAEAMKEDEYDPYYQEEEEDPYQSTMYDKGSSNSSLEANHPTLEQVVNLSHLQSDHPSLTSSSTDPTNAWTGRISDMAWNPDSFPELNDSITSHTSTSANGATFLTVEQGTHIVTTWDLNASCPSRIDDVSLSYPTTPRRRGRLDTWTVHPKLSWDPHNTNTCAVTQGSHVHFMDLRSSPHSMGGLKGCHALGVTHIDHNPNKPHVICTSGQDGLVKFWDVRYVSSSLYEDGEEAVGTSWRRQEPIKILRGGHSHWTTTVKYNPNHDQLLLSGGTDGIVNLWRISSISSAPLLDLGDAMQEGSGRGGAITHAFSDIQVSFESEDNDFHDRPSSMFSPVSSADEKSVNTEGGNAPDVRVNNMEMSEAVYDVAWSAADPWVYLSLGFDGTVSLNHVPSEEKYKILL